MKPSDYKISLDILESQSQYSLPMKKGDTARVVYIALREGGVPYEIGADCFAVLSGRKPDGTVLENNCVIKGNTIIYEITPQTTAVSGLVDCEIKLYGVDNGLICSARFSIIVDKRVVGDEEVESSSEFSALTKLYSNVVTSENARVDAEVERMAAEGDRAKAEQKREANITQAIEDAEEATERANDIANTLQDKLDKGEFKGDKGDKGDMPTDVANAIKNTVSGNPIVIDDASPIEHTLDVKVSANETVYVRGKNLIPFNNKSYNNGKYVAGQTYTISGVSFTVNDNGSVYVVGTATNGSAMFVLSNNPTLEAGRHTVTLSGCPNTDCYIAIVTGSNTYYDYDSGVTAENVNIEKSRISFVVKSGATVDATFYPMLEFGDTVSEFTSPVGSCSATADEHGVVNGLVSVAKEMSIFTETGTEIECTYNRDTNAVVGDIETALDSIIAMQESLIGGASV